MGQHERELNPYWKDGGTGLPEEDPKIRKGSSASSAIAGDGGVSWLQKAYQRCVERAKEEGLSLEDVAAEQYGASFNDTDIHLFCILISLFLRNFYPLRTEH